MFAPPESRVALAPVQIIHTAIPSVKLSSPHSTDHFLPPSSAPPFEIGALIKKLQGPNKAEEKARLMSLRGEPASSVLDECQTWLDRNLDHPFRRKVLRMQVGIAGASHQLPRTLFISGVYIASRDPERLGAFADIFRGTWKDKPVALKRLRTNATSETMKALHEQFYKECLVWSQLQHPNILPFYGVDRETFKDKASLAFVSPWMERGTVMDFLGSDSYDARVFRLRLMIEIAAGLRYLHGQQIIHGDLHGGNVLIADDGHACLTDFGLTVVGDLTRSKPSISGSSAGIQRWLAPEAFHPDPVVSRKTLAGDIFAFGRMCLAICTTRRPFADMNDKGVYFLVYSGVQPPRPTEEECSGLPVSKVLWDLIQHCWEVEPHRRPTMEQILGELRSLSQA